MFDANESRSGTDVVPTSNSFWNEFLICRSQLLSATSSKSEAIAFRGTQQSTIVLNRPRYWREVAVGFVTLVLIAWRLGDIAAHLTTEWRV